MNSFFSLLAAAVVCCCVTACQNGGKAGSKNRMAARLEIRAPFETVVYQVEDRTCALQEVGLNGRVLAESQREMTPEETAAFWAALDQLQVREWRRDYGVDPGDGSRPPTLWKLATRRGKVATASQGIGTFPSDDLPKKVSGETTQRFHTLYSLFQNTALPPTAQVAERVADRAVP